MKRVMSLESESNFVIYENPACDSSQYLWSTRMLDRVAVTTFANRRLVSTIRDQKVFIEVSAFLIIILSEVG